MTPAEAWETVLRLTDDACVNQAEHAQLTEACEVMKRYVDSNAITASAPNPVTGIAGIANVGNVTIGTSATGTGTLHNRDLPATLRHLEETHEALNIKDHAIQEAIDALREHLTDDQGNG